MGRGTMPSPGPIFTRAWRPGASEVKGATKVTVDDSSTRVTLLTPTGGKKVRIVDVMVSNDAAQGSTMEVYFDTGTTILTNAGNEIFWARTDGDIQLSFGMVWPDGGGPVGAVDKVVSVRTGTNITTSGIFLIHYREE